MDWINKKLRQEDKICLNNDDCTHANLALSVLRHAYDCTLKLQIYDFTLADLYYSWIDLVFKLQAIDKKLANDILLGMKKKEKSVIQNASVAACVYLHPGYHVLLEPATKLIAKEHLSQLWRRLDSAIVSVTSTNASLQFDGPNSEEGCRNITELISFKKRQSAVSRPENFEQLSLLLHAFERMATISQLIP